MKGHGGQSLPKGMSPSSNKKSMLD